MMSSVFPMIRDQLGGMIADALRQHKAREHLDLMSGLVTSVDTTNKLVSVKLRGDGTATTNIPYLDSTTPAVNDYVAVLMQGRRSYLVIGRVKAVA